MFYNANMNSNDVAAGLEAAFHKDKTVIMINNRDKEPFPGQAPGDMRARKWA